MERIVGAYGPSKGRALMVFAGIHGNEHAGVTALERVFQTLEERKPVAGGRFIGVMGNTVALPRGLRYVDLDLNRAWVPERIERLSNGGVPRGVEEREMQELMRLIDELLDTFPGNHVFMDLHTSSAPGAPFATVGDTLRNRDFAARFPITKVLGIEEQIDGGLLEYVNNRGHVTLGFEAGQHLDPESILRHEALIWLGLEVSGVLKREDIPKRDAHVRVLKDGARGVPTFLEVRHRHAIEAGDEFEMEPGWHHFQPVQAQELLAHDKSGEIRAPEAGYVLLPLYQGKGTDGFFLGREVRPFWLWLSRVLRAVRVPHVIHLFPGVHRKPDDSRTVYVDTRIARWQSVNVFHLLGFRRIRDKEHVREFSRRVE